jgi:hypothetical protein
MENLTNQRLNFLQQLGMLYVLGAALVVVLWAVFGLLQPAESKLIFGLKLTGTAIAGNILYRLGEAWEHRKLRRLR